MIWSVDWLSVSQDHPAGCRVLGADFVIHTDPNSGEVTREHIIGHQHEGSHDSSLRIRSDGHRVEISGNPSRYNRPDNLFGFETVDEAMALYNRLLRELGLPEFTKGDGLDRVNTGTVQIVGGARFSRVDLARNYAAGSSDESALALKGLAACSRRGQPWLVGKGGMVYSGSKKYARAKYYDKALEMKSHSRKAFSKGEYRQRVQRWCEESGVLRFEVELGRDLLLQRKMNGWILWNDERARQIADSYNRVNEMQCSSNDFQHIAEDLQKLDVKPTRALKAQHAAMAWLAGEDLRKSMSRSAFYRVTGDLRLLGIDARGPCNVSTLSIRVRVVELIPADPPDWYDLPEAA